MTQILTIERKQFALLPKSNFDKILKRNEDLEDYINVINFERKANKKFISHEDLKAKILARKD